MDQLEQKTMEERMAEAEKTARNYFRMGLNCSECVLRTFLDMHDTGLPNEVITLASGFGGGMGKTKNTCGAITGAVLALGCLKGRKDPFHLPESIDRMRELEGVYTPFAALVNEIEKTYGTLICKELSNPYGDFESRERKKSCQQIIGHCAALAEKYSGQ